MTSPSKNILFDLAKQECSRRSFVKGVAATAAGTTLTSSFGAEPSVVELREASFYERNTDGGITCRLCPRQCVLHDGEKGYCKVRTNRKGRLFSLVYGRVAARNNDPIEKKPLFHVYPGSKSFSIATYGCNISCKFCQNWEIAQEYGDIFKLPFTSPDSVVKMALKANPKPLTVAYTYNEPTIFTEFMHDCARAAKEAGLGNVMISNGFINKEPLKKLCEVMTAIKIDLKAFSQEFYGNVCGARFQPVLNTLKTLADSGIWFEIVTLVIPTLNDSADELKQMSAWILKELGPDVPIHFTRFHPDYKLRNLPNTPVATLKLARDTAMKEGCRYVYTGNMPGGDGEKTYCPNCGNMLIHRYGMFLVSDSLAKGTCEKCGTHIPGVWA